MRINERMAAIKMLQRKEENREYLEQIGVTATMNISYCERNNQETGKENDNGDAR